MIEYLGNYPLPEDIVEKVEQLEYKFMADLPRTGGPDDLEADDFQKKVYKYYKGKDIYYWYEEDWMMDLIPDEFFKKHNVKKLRFAVYRKDPGTFTAPHWDYYKRCLGENGHKELVEERFDDVFRLWIPISNRKFGEALFVEDQTLSDWRAGDVYTFSNHAYHAACNAGLDIRYVLLGYCEKLSS